MKKNYPCKTINGIKKRMHIHVMEQHLGRELEKDEFVHNRSGDRSDYSIDNLVVIRKNRKERK